MLIERDPIIASVWKYLKTATREDILSIPDLEPDQSTDDLQIPQAAKWLVGLWLNRGVESPRKRPSKWMRDGIRPGSFWGDRVRKTIASQLSAIQHWDIYEGSYSTYCFPGPATWFIDPPYQLAGRHYRFGASQLDYGELGQWCMSREGQVIVCENEGANWLEFKGLSDIKTTRRKQRCCEVM
ncbi:MAG: hypothetical protein HC888_07900 [Candidatus Competibacteraceae bacterium]|nr:hypothetical protein [Candidatus Competibacteraceae bacterium]